MKKRIQAVLMAMAMTTVLFTGCGNKAAVQETEQDRIVTQTTGTESGTETEVQTEETARKKVDITVGSLKGPTSMGLVSLMEKAKNQETENQYTFTMETAADVLLPQVVKKEMDIALVPANVAAALYQKTQGGISVIDINTLGVLYVVSADDKAVSVKDLKGKTVYLTGKGTTPDYVMQYLLTANGMKAEDVTLEYKSEAAEVAALLAENPNAYGVLPQPFATAACMKNDSLKAVIDLTKEWDTVQKDGSRLVTGVTIVNNEFLKENPEAVAAFMEEHKHSAEFANENVAEAAELVAAAGIMEKAPAAAKAMPYCNITYMDGTEMKEALSGYLQVLFEQNPEAVGGKLPEEDFYYIR